jgi:lipoprotein-releasing system ATP-binding protein
MLNATQITKTYRRHADSVTVLHGVTLGVERGEFLSIVGVSGSGKSTFLHLLGTLDQPDSGKIEFEGRRIDTLPNRDRERLRNETFGFVFQFYHLLPELTALENVLMPAYVGQSILGWWRTKKEWTRRAHEILDRVGLSHRKTHKPRELSGGEMQRAAVARALLTRPRVLLADEPTGNLDAERGIEIIQLLQALNRDDGLTIVMVTHNMDLARGTDRVVRMAGGRLVEEPASAPSAIPPFRPRLMAAAG